MHAYVLCHFCCNRKDFKLFKSRLEYKWHRGIKIVIFTQKEIQNCSIILCFFYTQKLFQVVFRSVCRSEKVELCPVNESLPKSRTITPTIHHGPWNNDPSLSLSLCLTHFSTAYFKLSLHFHILSTCSYRNVEIQTHALES